MKVAYHIEEGYVYRARLVTPDRIVFDCRTACDDYTEVATAAVRDGDIVRDGSENASPMARFFVSELLHRPACLLKTPPRGGLRGVE